jgi:hypothetical protein
MTTCRTIIFSHSLILQCWNGTQFQLLGKYCISELHLKPSSIDTYLIYVSLSLPLSLYNLSIAAEYSIVGIAIMLFNYLLLVDALFSLPPFK